MSSSLRKWDDVPMNIRDDVLNVIAANHIDFDVTQITGGVKDNFFFTESEDTNGRLGYNGDVYDGTYRIPDYKNFHMYVNYTVSHDGGLKRLALDFYDKGINRSDYIYMEINKR